MKRLTFLFVILPLILLSGCERKKEINYQEITGKVREILEMPTFEHVYRDIIYYGEEKKVIGIKVEDRRVLFSVDIVVRAGIDFKEGVAVVPGDTEGSIDVLLPKAKILLIDADEGSIHQFFEKSRGGRVTVIEYYGDIEAAKERIREDALKRDILYRAEENARKLLAKFLELAGFTEVRFYFPGEEKSV